MIKYKARLRSTSLTAETIPQESIVMGCFLLSHSVSGQFQCNLTPLSLSTCSLFISLHFKAAFTAAIHKKATSAHSFLLLYSHPASTIFSNLIKNLDIIIITNSQDKVYVKVMLFLTTFMY